MAVTDFIFNSDYPIDKILGTFQGSFIAAPRHGLFQPQATEESLSHGFGDYGLIVGAFSLDGTTWFPFGVSPADVSSGSPSLQTVECSAYCTTSEVVLRASNFTAAPETITYAFQVLSRD